MKILGKLFKYYDLAKKSKYFVMSSAAFIGIWVILFYVFYHYYLKIRIPFFYNFKYIGAEFFGFVLNGIGVSVLYCFYLNVYTFFYWLFFIRKKVSGKKRPGL